MCPVATIAPVVPFAPLVLVAPEVTVAPPVADTSGAAAALAPTVGGVDMTTVQVMDVNVTFNLEVPAPTGL